MTKRLFGTRKIIKAPSEQAIAAQVNVNSLPKPSCQVTPVIKDPITVPNPPLLRRFKVMTDKMNTDTMH